MHDLDLKGTGCQSFSCFRLRVAPIPNLGELCKSFFGSFGSKNFREMFSLTIYASLSNWFLWVTVKSQIEFFLTRSLNWWVCSDSCVTNLLRYAIMPTKCCKYCLDLEKGCLWLPQLYLDLEKSPFLCSKNISSVAPKTHLSLFSFKLDFWILFKN